MRYENSCGFSFLSDKLIQERKAQAACLSPSSPPCLTPADWPVLCWVAQSCPTPSNPMDCSPPGSSVHGDSPGKNTGVGCHALLQGIFPSQGSKPGLQHCRQVLTIWAPGQVGRLAYLLQSPHGPGAGEGIKAVRGWMTLPLLLLAWSPEGPRISDRQQGGLSEGRGRLWWSQCIWHAAKHFRAVSSPWNSTYKIILCRKYCM